LENPTRRTQTKQTSLSISLSVAYTALEKDQQRLLYIVSQCPAGCWTWSGDNYEVPDIDATIAALRRWHLINVGPGQGARRLFLLSPIKAFVEDTYEQNQNAEANEALLCLTRNLALQALVLWEKQSEDTAYGVMRFRQEFANYIHVLYKARDKSATTPEYLEFIGALASSLQVFCFVGGLTSRGAEIMQIGAEAAIRLNKVAAASGLLHQSIVLRRKGLHDAESIRNTVAELVDLASKCGDPHVAGNAAMAQGQLALAVGEMQTAHIQFQAAVRHYESSLQRARKTTDTERELSGKDATRKPGSHDSEHMLSLALMEQGFVLEHTGRQSDALRIYEQTMALMEEGQDLLNLGLVLHQVGNCNAHLRDYASAFGAYRRAAHIFLEIGVSGHLSNSVSELGYLLIDYDPRKSLDEALPEELLHASLADALAELMDCYYPEATPLRGELCMSMIRKLFGVAAALSFTSHNVLLDGWASTLAGEVLRPLAVQIERGTRRRDDIDSLYIMYLDTVTALIGSISGPGQTAGTGSKASIEEIEHLARLCYRVYDFGWQAFRLFDWLATYLGRCRHVENLTSEILREAIERLEEHNMPFSLPGFEKVYTYFGRIPDSLAPAEARCGLDSSANSAYICIWLGKITWPLSSST
jgi:tetratricopeptide (TPR) repeat protein